MKTPKTTEAMIGEVVEEFQKMANPETPYCNKVYEEGGYQEWLKNNPDKHLCSFEVYEGTMFSLDDERISKWLTRKLTDLANSIHKQSALEAEEIIKDELKNAPLEVQMTKGIIFSNVIQRIKG